MPYGILKVDTITFTAGGVDTSVSISGLVQNPTFTGNITSTGTISGNIIQGGTTVSGATVTGTAGQFGTLTGNTAGFTTVTGTTITGTTANLVTVSGTTVTGGTARFTTLTGISGVFTTAISGATVTGNTGQFTVVTGGTAGFTTVTGTTVTGTTANFTTLSGTTATITSGVFASGTAAAPSVSVGTTTNGLFSSGANEVAISTGGSGRLFVDASGRVSVGTATAQRQFLIYDSSFPVLQFANSTSGSLSNDGLLIYQSGLNATISNQEAGYFSVETSNQERLRITSTGALNFVGAGTAGSTQAVSFNGSAPVNSLVIDSSGRLGVGTSSPATLLNLNAGINTKAFQIEANNNFNFAIYSGQGGSNNDLVGQIGFDHSTSTKNSYINFYRGSSVTGGYMAFTVNNNTEAARIDSSGRLGIGTSSVNSGALLTLSSATTDAQSISIDSTGNGGGRNGSLIFRGTYGIGGGGLFDAAIIARVNNDDVNGANNSQDLAFYTKSGTSAPTEKVRITSSGRVGIGTTSPSQLLHVSSSSGYGTALINGPSGSSLALYRNGSARSEIYNDANATFITDNAGAIAFTTGGSTERARIDSSGRLLVGTSTARANFFNGAFSPGFQLEGTTVTNSSNRFASLVFGDGSSPGPIIALGKHRSSSIGGTTVVASGDEMGQISFQGSDGTEFVEGANIRAEVDGTPGANDMPGRLVFSTTADGASSPTEAMRINNQREVLIGTNTRTANGGVLQVSNGITFPATQSACSDANTLDDYEEGTWTPTIIGTSSAGTTTYTRQDGTYTKIGRLVTVSAWVSASATTGTGSLTIGGLPFSQQSTYYAPGALMVSDYNWSTGSYLTILVPPGANRCDIYASADDASWQLQNITNEVQQFMFTITYVV